MSDELTDHQLRALGVWHNALLVEVSETNRTRCPLTPSELSQMADIVINAVREEPEDD